MTRVGAGESAGLGAFGRFRAWSRRLDNQALLLDWKPVGLDLAAEPVRSEILRLARPKRLWRRPPVVVSDDDFVTEGEATAMLRSRRAPMPAVGILVGRGFLQICFRATDGAVGVTRTSVIEELTWRRTASFLQRLTRRLGGLVHGIS